MAASFMPQFLTEDDAPYLKVLLYTEKYSKLRYIKRTGRKMRCGHFCMQKHTGLSLSLSMHFLIGTNTLP